MFKPRSNPDLAMQADNLLSEEGECQKYASILYRQHGDLIWANRRAKPQDFADALGVNAAKVLKVRDIVGKALNDIAAAIGDESLKVPDPIPAGASYTASADGTVKITLPQPPAAQPEKQPPPAPGDAQLT